MTALIVPLIGPTLSDLGRQWTAAAHGRANMVEIRIDHLAPDQRGVPPRELATTWRTANPRTAVIVTCRPDWEGGHFVGPETQRRQLLTGWAAATQAEWLDIEAASLTRQPWPDWPTLRSRVILSFHDFATTPHDLPGRVAAMAAHGAAKLKIATHADNLADSLRVLRLLTADGPAPNTAADMIAIGMGQAGVITRVLAGRCGAWATFAALDDHQRSAPGQVTLREMTETYRWANLTPATRLYGVIGWPVGHSLSPALHNAGFAAVGHDGVYLPLPVEPGRAALWAALDELWDAPPLRLAGASVTIPHKQDAASWAAARRGDPTQTDTPAAINTLAVSPAGNPPVRVPQTANTDVTALRRLVTKLGLPANPRVLVLGAGGVAWAALRALPTGAVVTIANRDTARAAALAADAPVCQPIAIRDWDHRTASGPYDLLVNATSVGMAPNADESPLPAETLEPRTAVLDTVYNPPQTRLLREARAAGCRVVSGVEMFAAQADEQFRLWTGRTLPAAAVTEVLSRRLGLTDSQAAAVAAQLTHGV